MKIFQTNKSIVGGVEDTCIQGIAIEHVAKATFFLRDKIYTDKLKAAVTESLCNAIDEHRKHNIKRPVEIGLSLEELYIRDFATGLSDDDVKKVFFQYFESTKSDSNAGIGGFGIGAKAPGAYSDIYYVTSFFNGEQTVFMSSVNGYESQVSVIHKEPCDINETGICVKIPIPKQGWDQKDFSKFNLIIQDLIYQIGYNYPNDEIIYYKDAYNAIISEDRKSKELEVSDNRKLKNIKQDKEGEIYIKDLDKEAIVLKNHPFSSNFFCRRKTWAYDGDICYEIEVNNDLLKKYNLDRRNTYLFLFDRGSLPIAPSREAIELTTLTEEWLESKLSRIKEIVEKEYIIALEKLQDKKYPIYDICQKLNDSNIGPFSHLSILDFLSCNKNLLSDICDTCHEIDFTKFMNGNLVDSDPGYSAVYIKHVSSYNRPSFIYYRGRYFYFICDTKINIPYKIFFNTFIKFLTKTHGANYVSALDDCCKRRYALFITDPDKQQDFFDIVKDSKFNDIPLLHKNCDYFKVSDILALNTWKRPNYNTKKSERKIKLTNYFNESLEIKESDYSKTIIFSPSDLSANIKNIKLVLSYVKDIGPNTFNSIFVNDLGFNYFAKVYKDQIDHFKSKGCVLYTDLNFKEIYKANLSKNKWAFVPELLKNYLKSLNIDLYQVTGYRMANYGCSGAGYNLDGLNNFITKFYHIHQDYTQYINSIEQQFLKKLLAFDDKTLYNIYNVCRTNQIDCRFGSRSELMTRLETIAAHNKLLNVNKVKNQILKILKDINFDFMANIKTSPQTNP